MTTSAGGLEISMRMGLARLSQDITQAKGMVGTFSRDIDRAAATMKNALGAIGVGISVVGLIAFGKHTIDAIDKLNDLSKSTNLAVGDLAGLGYAAKISGGNLEGAAASINKLSQNIGKAPEKYRALGISAKEPLEAFKQLADIFVSIEDPQLRAAVAAEALGRGWAAAAPLLAEGGKRIGEMVEKGKELSGVTPELARQADEFNDKLAALAGTGALMNRVIGPMLPLLTQAVDGLLAARDGALQASVGFNPFVETLRALIVVAGNVGFVIRGIATEIGGMAAQVAAFMSGDFAGAGDIGDRMKEDAKQARAAFDEWEKGVLNVGQASASAAPTVRALSEESTKSAKAFLAGADAAKKAADEIAAYNEKMRQVHLRGEEEALKAEHEMLEEAMRQKYLLRKKDSDAAAEIREMEREGQLWLSQNVVKIVEEEGRQVDALRQANFVTFWTEVSDLAGNFFSDLVMNGKDAFDNLKKWVKQLLADMIALFAKRWVLNMVGQGSLATQAGQGSLAGGLLNAGTSAGMNWLGSTAIGTAGSYFASGVTGTMMGSAAGMGATVAGSATGVGAMTGGMGAIGSTVAAAIPYVAIALAIYAAWQHFADEGENWQAQLGFGANARAYTTQGVFGAEGFTSVQGRDELNSAIQDFMEATHELDDTLARHLSPESIDRIITNLAGPYTTRADGQPSTFAFDPEDTTAGAQLTLEYLKKKYGTVFDEIDSTFADFIRGFTGTADELVQQIVGFAQILDALDQMNITGLDIEALRAFQQDGETIEQTLQRVGSAWAWFQDAFTTDAEKLDRAQRQVTDVFTTLGIEIPATTTDFRHLVEGLDLSTESGRTMFTMLMGVAPAFLLVTNAAGDAANGIGDVTDALDDMVVMTMDLQLRIQEDVRRSRQSQLDDVIGARSGLQGFLNSTRLNTGLTTLDPMQRLNEARRQYEEVLGMAQTGDLGAAGRLSGVSETYLQIAREMFASSSRYVDIFESVMGGVGGVDARLERDQHMLEATLGMADTMVQVRDLLIDIRDGTYEAPKRIVASVDNAGLATKRR